MGKLKTAVQVVLATLLVFILLEFLSKFAGLPPGTNRYTESVILRSHLSTRKPAGEFRVFTYGESTFHGSQYWPYSNTPKWLAAYLKDFLPNKKIRVLNFARMGQNSFFIRETLEGTAAYKPDLAVFYLGHNDFLPGNRYDQELLRQKKEKESFKKLIRRSRFLSWIVRMSIARRLQRNQKNEDRMGTEKIETPPSGLGMENAVDRNGSIYKEGLKAFRHNVESMLEVARKNNTQVIFFVPVGNLKDFAPFCSQHDPDVSPEKLRDWEKFFEEGKKALARGDISGALAFLENAASIDNDHAELNYRLGQIYLKQGELQKAKQLFIRAKDYDCIIVRATSDVQKIFSDIRQSGKAVVIDTEKILIPEVFGGILGAPIIEDNVHFTVKGHALTGRALAQEIADRDWIAPKTEWQFSRERSFEEMAAEFGVTKEVIFNAYMQIIPYLGSRYDHRLAMAEKAFELLPDDPRAFRQLAWTYWLKGDRAKAVKIYEKLKTLHPTQFAEAVNNEPAILKAIEETTL